MDLKYKKAICSYRLKDLIVKAVDVAVSLVDVSTCTGLLCDAALRDFAIHARQGTRGLVWQGEVEMGAVNGDTHVGWGWTVRV